MIETCKIENFNTPGVEIKGKMIAEGFTIGEPKTAGWYLVAVRSNSEREGYFTLELWFNPMSVDKYYIRTRWIDNKCEAFNMNDRIRAYKLIPKF